MKKSAMKDSRFTYIVDAAFWIQSYSNYKQKLKCTTNNADYDNWLCAVMSRCNVRM